ncbi:MAG: hypothetical protein SFU91_04215 [Chloroherpetonaceae bacterium]|nr:hypothetical protein [Chloroherpetonaceae bacterium]
MKNYSTLFYTIFSIAFFAQNLTAQGIEQKPLQDALDEQGRIKKGMQGSFKAEGFQMQYGKNGEPIFLPSTQNTGGTWEGLGGNPPNLAVL